MVTGGLPVHSNVGRVVHEHINATVKFNDFRAVVSNGLLGVGDIELGRPILLKRSRNQCPPSTPAFCPGTSAQLPAT